MGRKKGATLAPSALSPTKLDSGVLVVEREFENLTSVWVEEAIPRYLAQVDHELEMEKDRDYKRRLKRYQTEFSLLVRDLSKTQKCLIICFQGRDAAGKSGAMIRLVEALDFDMRIFQSVPIGAPSEDELARPYLWRFLTGERMPRFGQVRVFDRCWAERALVERVERLTPTDLIRNSYAEMRTFEWLLESLGAIVVKFWLDISKEEQLRRFKKRSEEKPWKLCPSDMEARKAWDEYTDAANELFYRTGTHFAPWYLVSSENKRYSRLAVLRTLNDVMMGKLN